MSEKVRLTKEQAKAVKVFKDNNLTLKDYAYENLSEELDPIQILGIDKMARALYVGYEVETIDEEKRRRWWHKHGREVWELKERDLLRQVHNNTKHEVRRVYKDGCVSFVNDSGALTKLSIQNHYKVICFAEDRKDLDD